MHLQIKEVHHNPTTETFQIELLFDGHTSFPITFTNPTQNADLWEWYFEEYTQYGNPETILERKANEVKRAIAQYGKDLFEKILGSRKVYSRYKAGIEKSNLEQLRIEIDSKSTAFHAIQWEALYDADFSAPLALLNGVRFFRKNYLPVTYAAKVNAQPYLNLLIVTARPKEEDDVNYRTIQRPLMEAVQRSGQRVRVHILRPGTWKSLVKHLEDKGGGYYHIIHFDVHGNVFSYKELALEREKRNTQFSFAANSFQVNWGLKDTRPFEGKRAYLYFESEKKGLATPVDAKALAGQLKQYRIPVCILNACQSAKQDYTGNETSLGKVLVEQGMALVLAMRYSILAPAATIFMDELYKQLFRNKTVEQAIGLARRELYHNKNRQLDTGTIEVEDWLLPVVYLNKDDVHLALRDFDNAVEKRQYYIEKAQRLPYPPNFKGRDLDILKIEKLLTLRHNQLLISGKSGIGKTMLLKYLAAWWDETNFVTSVCYFSFAEKEWTLKQIIAEIAKKAIPKATLSDFLAQDVIIQQYELVDVLNQQRFALLFDEVTLDISTFLSGIHNSFVVYAIESKAVDWMNSLSKGNSYELKSYLEKPRILPIDEKVEAPEPISIPTITADDEKRDEIESPIDVDSTLSSSEPSQKDSRTSACCGHTSEILAGVLAIGLSDTEFNLFRESFMQHPLTDFGGNKHLIKDEVDFKALLGEIFETAELFEKPAIQAYFLDAIFADIQRLNDPSDWAKMLLKFNKLFKKWRSEWEMQHTPAKPKVSSKISSQQLSDIRDMIGNNLLKQAFATLKEILPNHSEVLSLASSFKNLEKENRMGIISSGEASTKRNKIVFALLGLVNELSAGKN